MLKINFSNMGLFSSSTNRLVLAAERLLLICLHWGHMSREKVPAAEGQ